MFFLTKQVLFKLFLVDVYNFSDRVVCYNMTYRWQLKRYLTENAYKFQEHPFKLKSGLESQHYLDCRSVLLHPEACYYASWLLRSYIHLTAESNNIRGIAGVVLGACPLVDEISSIEHKERGNFWHKIYVRKEEKGYGTNKLVETDFWLEQRKNMSWIQIILVEDVWTTGGSAIKAKEVLKEAGYDVIKTICLVDREEPDTLAPDFALFTLEEILPNGRELGRTKRSLI